MSQKDLEQTDSPACIRVLMACWNEEPQHLFEAVDSVRAQTLQNWELVVVDDGSTQAATLTALRSLSEDADPRIEVRRLHCNSGPSAARNLAAEGATAPYLFVLDADDQLTPEALQLSVESFRENPRVRVVTGYGSDFGARTTSPGIQVWDPSRVFDGGILANQSALLREDFEVVGGFDASMRYGLEDYEFWLRLLHRAVFPAGGQIAYLDAVCYRY